MGLFWKDLEIIPGMLLEVDLLHHEVFNSDGARVSTRWKILSFDSRTSEETYLDYSSGKKYPMKKVIKNRKLRAKLQRAELLQLPSGSNFMVVQVLHNGIEVFKRCYNLDMLGIVRNLRVLE